MSSVVEIRSALESEIAALASALAPEVGPEQVMQRWMESQQGYRDMLVAILDGSPVGTVSLGGVGHVSPNSLRLFALDVGPAFRGRGIGTRLIGAVEDKAREQRFARVNLEVEVKNVDAIRLYERLGYLRLGQKFIETWMDTNEEGDYAEVQAEFLAMSIELR